MRECRDCCEVVDWSPEFQLWTSDRSGAACPHVSDEATDDGHRVIDLRAATPREASAYLAGHRTFPGSIETSEGLMIPVESER